MMRFSSRLRLASPPDSIAAILHMQSELWNDLEATLTGICSLGRARVRFSRLLIEFGEFTYSPRLRQRPVAALRPSRAPSTMPSTCVYGIPQPLPLPWRDDGALC